MISPKANVQKLVPLFLDVQPINKDSNLIISEQLNNKRQNDMIIVSTCSIHANKKNKTIKKVKQNN